MRVAVTGGATNIGRSITECFLAQGASVAVGQHRTLATSLIEKYGERLKAVQLDQGNPDSCQKFIAEAARLLGGGWMFLSIMPPSLARDRPVPSSTWILNL